MKRIMAVYDVDPFYADRFAQFANQREKLPFTAVAFNSIGRLKAFAEQQAVEVLLVGEEVEEEELKDISVGQIVRLRESGVARGGGEVSGQETPSVYKYQSSDAVLREVMACYQAGSEVMPLAATGVKSFIAGVYSPVNRCGKTSFCLTMGQVLARDSHVLYMSLEEYSALSRLTSAVYRRTLSDLIYYFRQGEYNRMRLGTVLHNWGGMDYIPPAEYSEDLAEITGSELAQLVGSIASDGTYEVILLDLGHLTRNLEPLLDICDVIYAPVRDDCISSAKVDAWKRYLECAGKRHLLERTQFLRLPRAKAICQAENCLEQLLWGEMGDFVRNLLKGGRRGG